jgi:hypothetical protein
LIFAQQSLLKKGQQFAREVGREFISSIATCDASDKDDDVYDRGSGAVANSSSQKRTRVEQ